MSDAADSSDRSRLIALRAEAQKDLRVFRRMRQLLRERVDEVRAAHAEGHVTTELADFSGTEAARGAINLSIYHIEMMITAINVELTDMGTPSMGILRPQGDLDEC